MIEPQTLPAPTLMARPRTPWWKRLLAVLVVLLVLGGGVAAGAFYYLAHLVPGTPLSPWDLVGPAGGRFFGSQTSRNVLVLGIDYDYTDSGMPFSSHARSDTMFIMNLSRDGQHVGMLSMPRDMFVDFPDGHRDKVNAAYSLGGVPLVRRMLTRFLGIPIDYAVVVRIAAATKVIDRLGGLDIDVEKDMDYDDNWGHLHVHLKKGRRHLDGATAVGYARFRHDEEGDRGRMRRQQQVVNALIGKVRASGSTLARLERLNDLARIVRDNLQTDIKSDQWVDLARVYRNFDRKNFRTAHLDGADAVVDGAMVILPPDPATRRRVLRAVMADQPVQPQDIRIEVLNGSGVAGAAATLRDRLEKLGYQVVRIGDAPAALHSKQSYVLCHTEDAAINGQAGGLLKGIAGSLAVRRDVTPEDVGADLTIVLADDWPQRMQGR